MGSYGDAWVTCTYCGRWGKSVPRYWDYSDHRWKNGFWNVDGCGMLCEPCFDRRVPPHADYVHTVVCRHMPTTFPMPHSVAERIATYAYPVCAWVAECIEATEMAVIEINDECDALAARRSSERWS